MEVIEITNGVPTGTPFWSTIVGWIVTLIAAVIPCIYNFVKGLSLEQDIRDLKAAKAESINYLTFLDERQSLITKLRKYANALDLGNSGLETITQIERLLVRVSSFSELFKFSPEDKKIISEVQEKVNMIIAKNLYGSINLRSSDLERIIIILQKGENIT